MALGPVFECLGCGCTLFVTLHQLPVNPSNGLHKISTDIQMCIRCKQRFVYRDGIWERL